MARPLTKEELTKVINGFEGKYALRNKCLFILGIHTGFRISELLSIKVIDIMPYNKIVDEITVKKRNMKKKKKSRTIKLNNSARKIALEYIENWDQIYKSCIPIHKKIYLFKSQKSDEKPLGKKSAIAILDKVFKSLNLEGKLGSHCMRKSFAKEMYLLLGKDIMLVKDALGHQEISSTQHYLSTFDNEKIYECIDKLSFV